MANNNTANVSVGKGVAGGYFFAAPAGTAVPTDIETALPAAFENLGFIAEDGITESIDTDNTEIPDMNGDQVVIVRSSYTESIAMKLIEVKKGVLALQHGESNVTDVQGLITVHHNSTEGGNYVLVCELVLKDGRRWRKVVPEGKVTELGEMTISSSEVVGREVTITCLPDENGDRVIDYIESTETH